MSFISLPHEFDPATGECRGFQIALSKDGELVPMGFLRGDAGLPVDLQKLSENLVSAMNGNGPLHQIGRTHHMFYEEHPGGLNFRFRHPDDGGVSETRAMFTTLPDVEIRFDENN